MEKAVDFCFRKGKAVGETKPTERGDSTFGGFLVLLENKGVPKVPNIVKKKKK